MKTKSTQTKSQLFKKLIKEAIREALKEEFELLREELKNSRPIIESHQDFIKDFTPNYKEFLPKPQTPPIKPVGPNYSYQNTQTDPIKRILAQTAKSMTQEDFQTIRMNSNMVEMDSPVVNNGMLAQNMNVGEMQEWKPSNMKDFNFPM